MKQKEAIEAYGAILRLSDISLPLRDAYNVFCLRRKLEPIYQFEMERERKLLEELHGEITPDGSLRFDNVEAYMEFNKKVAEMSDMEIDDEHEVIQIKIDDLKNAEMKAADINRLYGFVEFVK